MSGFLSQGGYAFYVWSSYGMGLVLLVLELLQLRNHRRTILARLGRLMRMRADEQGGLRHRGAEHERNMKGVSAMRVPSPRPSPRGRGELEAPAATFILVGNE